MSLDTNYTYELEEQRVTLYWNETHKQWWAWSNLRFNKQAYWIDHTITDPFTIAVLIKIAEKTGRKEIAF